MRRIAIASLVCLAAALPAAAEDAPDRDAPGGEGDVREGLSLLEEGTRLMLRGLLGEMEPALRELQDRIGDLSGYYAPEVLPNGDILIRRKTPLAPEPDAAPPAAEGEEIEL